jgi:phage terminase large subunit
MPDYWIPNFKAGDKTHLKQVEIFNCYKRYMLVCGSRRSGKTIAVLHRVMRHLWETPGARVALVTKTNKVGKEGGVWADLIEMTVPEWINSNMVGINGLPLEYVSENRGIPGPRMDSATRTSSFRIRNYYSGESELIHLSLDNVAEVEAKFKGTRYSMIWFSELSEFDSLNVFTSTIQQLRIGLWEHQQFIADTNPAVEGEDSWIYQLWYVRVKRTDVPEDFAQGIRFKTKNSPKKILLSFHLIHKWNGKNIGTNSKPSKSTWKITHSLDPTNALN